MGVPFPFVGVPFPFPLSLTRECLVIDVARRLKSEDVLERLSNLFVRRRVPKYIRSRPTLRVGARGPEFTANKVRD